MFRYIATKQVCIKYTIKVCISWSWQCPRTSLLRSQHPTVALFLCSSGGNHKTRSRVFEGCRFSSIRSSMAQDWDETELLWRTEEKSVSLMKGRWFPIPSQSITSLSSGPYNIWLLAPTLGAISSKQEAKRHFGMLHILCISLLTLLRATEEQSSVELSCRHIWPDYESHWFGKINNFKINLVNMIHGRKRKTW